MHRRQIWIAAAVSVALLVGAVSCGGGEAEKTASDESGEVSIHVHAGELYFDPEVIRVKAGDTVRVVFDNHGATLHDFTTDDERFIIVSEDGAAHGGAGDAHDEAGAGLRPLHVAAEGGTEAELLFKAEAPGEYAVFCSVPGHRDGGMEARIIVTA